MNPCIDYCFNHFGKEYTKDCDNNCEYAKVIVENKKLQADLAHMTAERDEFFQAMQRTEPMFLTLEWLQQPAEEDT